MHHAAEGDPARSQAEHDDETLLRIGGEFRSGALETAFAWERLGETLRHARTLMAAAAVLNLLFLFSDWRFAGTPHFLIAVPARIVVVLASVACLLMLRQSDTPGSVSRIMGAWMAVAASGVALLVTSHSTVALFVVVMLPMIFYLTVPIGFRWLLAGGTGCSLLLFLGYGEYTSSTHTALGIALALVILNYALAMSVARGNRMQRLQWLTARSERRIAAELAESREMLEQIFAASPVPMTITDGASGKLVHLNDGAVQLFGSPRETMLGAPMTRYYADGADQQRILDLAAEGRRVIEFETEVRTGDGSPRFVMVKSAAVDTQQGRLNISGIIDISDRKATERSLEWLASTDGLTGLPNRLSFFTAARAEMMRAVRSARPLTLLMIDLDHFKAINDTFGHQAGDLALRAFATLCLSSLRDNDVVGRLGGEEFGVLLPGTDLVQAQAVAEQLRIAVEGMRLPGDSPALRLSVSIGVSPVLGHERDLDHALARADLALYAAKRGGRNRVACNGDGDALAAILPDRRRGTRTVEL